MARQLTLKEVLEKAISKEIESRLLYISLRQRVKDKAVRDAFAELARQEQGHRTLLEKYQRGELKEGALSTGQAVDYRIAERLDQPQVSGDMKLQDTFLLAANREKASHEFYVGLGEVHPPGKVRSLLSGLAAQELEHKQRVESLYAQVAFPQTNGG